MLDKVILHCDLNNFFASCEQVTNPELKNKPLAVCGSVKDRHGIVLAKNNLAKSCGITTGMTINNALNLCKDVVFVQSNFSKYLDYSDKVRKILLNYTDVFEPFGIDEGWLDVTNSKFLGSGEEIANSIRNDVKNLGLTASVGVSFNKTFAKLGSDYKKPDATTVISKDNYKDVVWPLPVGDLLMVGHKTAEKLSKFNVHTIGELANVDCGFLQKHFGKCGGMLKEFACGEDLSLVKKYAQGDDVKSVGNSMTCYRDLETYFDAEIMFSILADSVSARLIKNNLGRATTLSISYRDEELNTFTRQAKLNKPSQLDKDFFELAMALFKENYNFKIGIRSLGLQVSDFVSNDYQVDMFTDEEDYEKRLSLAKTIGGIRSKYGNSAMQKGVNLKDVNITRESPDETHIIHPIGYTHNQNDDKN